MLIYSLLIELTQHRLVVTDVSGQPIDPIFKTQTVKPRRSNLYGGGNVNHGVGEKFDGQSRAYFTL
jgi:hypothetical protein